MAGEHVEGRPLEPMRVRRIEGVVCAVLHRSGSHVNGEHGHLERQQHGQAGVCAGAADGGRGDVNGH